jgi:C-terminal processing protease CtpA/Prc
MCRFNLFLCQYTDTETLKLHDCFQYNQMFNNQRLFSGDEILAVNGRGLEGMSHNEAIAVFKQIKSGSVLLHVGRRPRRTQAD